MIEELFKNFFDVWAQGLSVMAERNKYGYPINEGSHFFDGDDE